MLTLTMTTTMLSLYLAGAPPLDDDAATEKLNARAALWRSRAQTHEAAQQWCDALFYRGHALAAVPDDDVTRYHAFVDAYAADQLRTANALARDLHIDRLSLDDDAKRKVDLILSDLASLGSLVDAECTHAPVCGDGLVEGNEMCDAVDGGCTSTCELVADLKGVEVEKDKPPRVALSQPAAVASPPAKIATTSAPAHGNELVIAGVVASSAGLVTAGTGAAIALKSDETLADPFSTGSFKEDALSTRTAGWITMGVGAAVATVGAIFFGVDYARSREMDGANNDDGVEVEAHAGAHADASTAASAAPAVDAGNGRTP